MLHILDRFLIHFFSAPGLILGLTFGLGVLERRARWSWLPHSLLATSIWAAGIIFACSALREAYDVSQGGTLTKSIFDYISWAGGCGLTPWAIYRLGKWR